MSNSEITLSIYIYIHLETLATTMKLTQRKHKMEDIISSYSPKKSRVSTFDEPQLDFCNRSKIEKSSSGLRSAANHEVDNDDKTKSEEKEEHKTESGISKVKKILDYDSDQAYWLGLHQDVEKEQWSMNQNIRILITIII